MLGTISILIEDMYVKTYIEYDIRYGSTREICVYDNELVGYGI